MVRSSLENKARRRPRKLSGQTEGVGGRKMLPQSSFPNKLVSLGSSSDRPSTIREVQRKFGERIRTLRQQKGLSQQRLSKECRISAREIKRIEAGEVDVSLFVMVRLAHGLRIHLDLLLEGVQ